MPIIAGRASAAYGAGFGKLLSAGGGYSPDGAFDALATVSLSTSASSITFSGIPTGYRSLQVRALYRGTVGAGDGTVFMRFNGDSNSNYSTHRTYGYGGGGAMGADGSINSTTMSVGHSMGATPSLQSFTVMITDIIDYTNDSKHTTVRSLTGTDMNGDASGALFFNSGNWRNKSSVTSLTLTTGQTAFATYSHFALYGVK